MKLIGPLHLLDSGRELYIKPSIVRLVKKHVGDGSVIIISTKQFYLVREPVEVVVQRLGEE